MNFPQYMSHARVAELINRRTYGCMSHVVIDLGSHMSKRMSYTNGFKRKANELVESSGNRSAGRELGGSEKLVRDWRKKDRVDKAT